MPIESISLCFALSSSVSNLDSAIFESSGLQFILGKDTRARIPAAASGVKYTAESTLF